MPTPPSTLHPFPPRLGPEPGGTFIKGIDMGIVGMELGGQRRVIVPPEFGYGKQQVQEIPPGATLEVDIELLSVKKVCAGLSSPATHYLAPCPRALLNHVPPFTARAPVSDQRLPKTHGP